MSSSIFNTTIGKLQLLTNPLTGNVATDVQEFRLWGDPASLQGFAILTHCRDAGSCRSYLGFILDIVTSMAGQTQPPLQPNVHFFGLLEEAGVAEEEPQRHWVNIQIQHRKPELCKP